MALDAEVSDLLKTVLVIGAQHSSALTQAADRNATQGLTVINSTLIQQHGSTADDAATMAAMRTAIHIPQKPSGES
jgi:hypothetical protein